MKRFVFITIIAIASAVSAHAQFSNPARYSDLKHEFSAKNYVQQVNDPYNKTWSEVLAFFVPGSSQIMMREPVRGLIFLGASYICEEVIRDSAAELLKHVVTDADGTVTGFDGDAKVTPSLRGVLGGAAALLGVAIWSSIDAGKVAKVKNQYYQKITARPNVSFTPGQSGSLMPAAGVSLSMNF